MRARNQVAVRADGVVEVRLTRGKVALVDAADLPLIAPYRWWARQLWTGKRRDIWYASAEDKMVARRRGDTLQMHRVIMGVTDPEQLVDHRNFDGLDNQRTNLRLCTKAQNTAHCRRQLNNTSGFTGVRFRADLGRWSAYLKVGGRQRYLGLFNSAVEAAVQRDGAARDAFGEFAHLNFPDPAEVLA